jgi:hypothetical protein
MVVFEDAELWPFSSTEEARTEFYDCCKLHTNTTVWAEQYEAVVVIRRVVLHHAEVIRSSPANVKEAVNAALLGAEALRSCRVRNGIMCLRALLTNCSDVLSFADSSSSSSTSAALASHCERIVGCLLTKSGGGPRFIVELALNALLQQGVSCVPPLSLAIALFPALCHRNPEIAGNAILALVASVRRLDAGVLSDTAEEGMQRLKEVVQGLALALNAKRAKAKDEAKAALKTIKATMGDAHFEALMNMHLSASQIGEVTRLLNAASTATTPGGMTGSAMCTPASALPRSVTASAGNSVMHMSLSEQRSGLPRPPLRMASSAQGGVQGSGISKFKLHMQASALSTAKAGASHARMDVMSEGVDVVCAVVVPSRAPTPGVVVPACTAAPAPTPAVVASRAIPSSSSATPASQRPVVAATPPVSSLRDHILRMKQEKRAAEVEQQKLHASAGADVLPEMLVKESAEETSVVASSTVQADVMDVCPTPCKGRITVDETAC